MERAESHFGQAVTREQVADMLACMAILSKKDACQMEKHPV